MTSRFLIGYECHVDRLEYDFEKYRGFLVVSERRMPAMEKCIKIFRTIDPDVQIIQVSHEDHPSKKNYYWSVHSYQSGWKMVEEKEDADG